MSAIPAKKFAYVVTNFIFFIYLQIKKPKVQIKSVISPTKTELTKSNKFLET